VLNRPGRARTVGDRAVRLAHLLQQTNEHLRIPLRETNRPLGLAHSDARTVS
jgi:hypothetical protein